MPKLVRSLAALLAASGLLALTACGDDDGAATDTTAAEARDPEEGGDEASGATGEEEGGAPDENPCAEGASGSIGGQAEAPADGAAAVELTAAEYAFQGGDELAAQGEYALTLTNTGQELHEARLVRLSDEETRSVADILASGEEPELTEVAFAFACPGASAEPVAATIDEPGRYLILCFVPVGALPTTPPEQLDSLGPPHVARGMVKELTVS